MAKKIIWKLDEHTIGKHVILREYLKAWLPIIGQREGRMVFVDGFAGPGEYEDGEDGSPIIAMKALIEHPARSRFREIRFLFVEHEPERAAHLDTLVEALRPKLPANTHATVVNETFESAVGSILDALEANGSTLAPSLLLVDPYGVSGLPLDMMRRCLVGPKKELVITFMSDFIRRFRSGGEFRPHLDRMFGGEVWRSYPGPLEDLYRLRLKAIGAKFVVPFKIMSGGRHVYTLFFATKHATGCDKMKAAMWKAAPDGNFAYQHDRTARIEEQPSLLSFASTNLTVALMDRFGGESRVSIARLQEWVTGDETVFHSGQLKTALKDLESLQRIHVVEAPPKRRVGQFPDGTVLSFE